MQQSRSRPHRSMAAAAAAYRVELLLEIVGLEHLAVPFVLEQLQHARNTGGSSRSWLDDLASIDGNQVVDRQRLARDGALVVRRDVLLDERALIDLTRALDQHRLVGSLSRNCTNPPT